MIDKLRAKLDEMKKSNDATMSSDDGLMTRGQQHGYDTARIEIRNWLNDYAESEQEGSAIFELSESMEALMEVLDYEMREELLEEMRKMWKRGSDEK